MIIRHRGGDCICCGSGTGTACSCEKTYCGFCNGCEQYELTITDIYYLWAGDAGPYSFKFLDAGPYSINIGYNGSSEGGGTPPTITCCSFEFGTGTDDFGLPLGLLYTLNDNSGAFAATTTNNSIGSAPSLGILSALTCPIVSEFVSFFSVQTGAGNYAQGINYADFIAAGGLAGLATKIVAAGLPNDPDIVFVLPPLSTPGYSMGDGCATAKAQFLTNKLVSFFPYFIECYFTFTATITCVTPSPPPPPPPLGSVRRTSATNRVKPAQTALPKLDCTHLDPLVFSSYGVQYRECLKGHGDICGCEKPARCGEGLCPDYQKPEKKVKWAYGVTTVSGRKELLTKSLASLARAGFPEPRIFEDRGLYAFGNWVLGLHELLIRDPEADLYAMFQDDIVCCSNLREYVEKSRLPDKTYINLICYPLNEQMFRLGTEGWGKSNGMGKGAQGLVFTREAVVALLSERDFISRSLNTQVNGRGLVRGRQNIDGGVVEAMRRLGYTEYVHFPSLLDHVGTESAIGNAPQPKIACFRGEEYDPRDLLDKK